MRKTRISMTISEDVLKKLDGFVGGESARSRSEAIEKILNGYLEGNKVAVILGGGDTEKLMVGGVFRPLVRIGKKALIEHNIEILKKSGFRKLYVIGKNELIGECFKLLGDGSGYMVDIKYIEEKKTLGNAKTLELAKPYVNSPFLVLPIDNFFDFDLNYLFRIHRSNRGTVTLAVQAGRDSVSNVGVVEMAGDLIISYEEKAKRPKTFLTSTFIGMYDPSVFEYIPGGNILWVLQTDVFPRLISEGKLCGCIVTGNYVNIHSEADLRRISNTKVLSGNK